jgi:hypothetical protein
LVTLPFTQTIPDVSVQHAVEEIDDIPELSISQSVAARAIVRSEHRMNTMNPFLRIERGRIPWAKSMKRYQGERDEERFILSMRDVGAWAVRAWEIDKICIL